MSRYLSERYSRATCSSIRKALPLKLRVMSKTASPRRKPWSRNGISTSLSRTILPLNQATRSFASAIGGLSVRCPTPVLPSDRKNAIAPLPLCAASAPQYATRRLFDLGDEALGKAFYLGISEGAF